MGQGFLEYHISVRKASKIFGNRSISKTKAVQLQIPSALSIRSSFRIVFIFNYSKYRSVDWFARFVIQWNIFWLKKGQFIYLVSIIKIHKNLLRISNSYLFALENLLLSLLYFVAIYMLCNISKHFTFEIIFNNDFGEIWES